MSDQSQIRVRVRVSYLAVANDGEGEAAPSRSRSADLKNRFGLDNRCGQRTIRRGGDLTCFVGAPATQLPLLEGETKRWSGRRRVAVALAPARCPSPRLTETGEAERRGESQRRGRGRNELGFGSEAAAGYILGVPEVGQADLSCCARAGLWAELAAQARARGWVMPGTGTKAAGSGRAWVDPSSPAHLENYRSRQQGLTDPIILHKIFCATFVNTSQRPAKLKGIFSKVTHIRHYEHTFIDQLLYLYLNYWHTPS